MTNREESREFRRILRERIDEFRRCELCGCKRSLELHHIIPAVLGGGDSDDNLILLCGGCHAKLTPKKELAKIGARANGAKRNIPLCNAQKVFDEIGRRDAVSAVEVMDIIEELAYWCEPYGCTDGRCCIPFNKCKTLFERCEDDRRKGKTV